MPSKLNACEACFLLRSTNIGRDIEVSHNLTVTSTIRCLRRRLFEFLDRSRPVVLQKPRHRAIRQHLPLRLAARAVVRFVFRIDDALHARAADRAWLAEAAMYGHIGPESSHFFGKK